MNKKNEITLAIAKTLGREAEVNAMRAVDVLARNAGQPTICDDDVYTDELELLVLERASLSAQLEQFTKGVLPMNESTNPTTTTKGEVPMIEVKSVKGLFEKTSPRKYAATAASLNPRQRATFIGYVTKGKDPKKAASFVILVMKRVEEAETKAAAAKKKLTDATAVPSDDMSNMQRQLNQAKVTLELAPDPTMAYMFTDVVDTAILFAADQVESICYKIANMAAFRAQSSLIDTLSIKANEHGELTERQLAMLADKQAIVDGSAIVYQYLMDYKNFSFDDVERMVERKITEATTKKLYKEVRFVEESFARKLRMELKRATRRNPDMDEDDIALFTEKLRLKEDRHVMRRNERAKGTADYANQLIEEHGAYIERELRKTYILAGKGGAAEISELPEGYAISLANAVRKVFDCESEYVNSEGRLQWLDSRISGELSHTMSEGYKDMFEEEHDKLWIFLDDILDPSIAKMERFMEQKRRSRTGTNDMSTRNDMDRKAGDGEEPEIVR